MKVLYIYIYLCVCVCRLGSRNEPNTLTEHIVPVKLFCSWYLHLRENLSPTPAVVGDFFHVFRILYTIELKA